MKKFSLSLITFAIFFLIGYSLFNEGLKESFHGAFFALGGYFCALLHSKLWEDEKAEK